jgi:hypothetical protein
LKDKYLINNAIRSLHIKISELNLPGLEISDHTKDYLIKYTGNYSFFMSAYSQLFQKALKKMNKPVNKSVFVDYGGGCGILSLLAKLTGFKTVIYNDIYERSVKDAEILSKKLDIPVDYFIQGDAKDLVDQILGFNIEPDVICSFDVVEHIYDLETWIGNISKLRKFSLFFITGANPKNPVIARRLKKLHIRAEYQGCEKNIRYNDIWLNTSFLSQREIIIRELFPDLNNPEVEFLSKTSRGLRKDDIEKMVREYIKTGKTGYKIDHQTNTCDPYTGSWTEKLIDLERLKDVCADNYLLIDITSSFYCYTNNRMLNTVKFLINQVIKVLGPKNLYFSPTITLEIQKKVNYT